MLFIRPMLAVAGTPFSDDAWFFEPKVDGTRCIVHRGEGRTVLQNRRLVSVTHRYPELARALDIAAPERCVLDGEITVISGGMSRFSSLQERELVDDPLRIEALSRALPASIILFDILSLDGRSLMQLPLEERKVLLSASTRGHSQVAVAGYVRGDGELFYKAAVSRGFEGMVAKRRDSPYQPGVRSRDWVKCKKEMTLDLVIGGYTRGRGERGATLGSLLLGAYDADTSLVYVGKAGSGISREDAARILVRLRPVGDPPFSNPPQEPGITWVAPDMVAMVRALEVTPNGRLRAPVFLRLRPDKSPGECLLSALG